MERAEAYSAASGIMSSDAIKRNTVQTILYDASRVAARSRGGRRSLQGKPCVLLFQALPKFTKREENGARGDSLAPLAEPTTIL